MFAEEHFNAVRIEAVAAAADVSVGSIYSYFGNKDGLYLAVAYREIERVDSYLDDAVRPEQSPWEQVLATGDAYRELLLTQPAVVRFLTSDVPESVAPRIRDAIRVTLDATRSRFADKIQTAIDAEHIDGVDAHLLASFLIGSWVGVASLAQHTAGFAMSTDQARACLVQASALLGDGMLAHVISGR